MKTYSVYILRCADDSLYVGVTNNLERRLHQHISVFHANSYVSNRLPVKLVYVIEFTDIREAINLEKQLKRWSRAKKEALIRGKFGKLRRGAECRNASHFGNLVNISRFLFRKKIFVCLPRLRSG
jgi:putative endonuclease